MLRSATRTALAAAAAALTLVLAGCRGGPSMEPADAEASVVDVVEQTKAGLGGRWTHVSGPGLGMCPQRFGARGVVYVLIAERDAGDPEADVAIVEELWASLGMTTSRRTGGGVDPDVGLIGEGGPVSSIEFDASRLGYTIDGSSPCVAGDLSGGTE